MKKYQELILELVTFTEDVITTSPAGTYDEAGKDLDWE